MVGDAPGWRPSPGGVPRLDHPHAEQRQEEAVEEDREPVPDAASRTGSPRPGRARAPRRRGRAAASRRATQDAVHAPSLASGDGVELEPVVDEAVAEPAGDLGLQRLDLLGPELDHVAGLEVDQVVVVLARGLLVARAPAAELEPLDDALGLEELHGPVDGRERDRGRRPRPRGGAVRRRPDGRPPRRGSRAMTRRWPVMRRPLSRQARSIAAGRRRGAAFGVCVPPRSRLRCGSL